MRESQSVPTRYREPGGASRGPQTRPQAPKPHDPLSTIKFGGAAARPASEKGILIAKLLDEREEERRCLAPDNKFQRCPTTGAREGLPASKQPT